MDFLCKKTERRLFVRNNETNSLEPVSKLEPIQIMDEIPAVEDMLTELQYFIPSNHSKERLMVIWKATIAYRNEQRANDNFLQFLRDFPAASSFNGELLLEEFTILNPKANDVISTWTVLQPKLLSFFDEMYLHITSQFVRSLAILKNKNPTRGSRQVRGDARKIHPLHGIIDWIDPEGEIPACEFPQIFVAAEQFQCGDCYLVWDDFAINTGRDLEHSFILLSLSC
ncbi:uncharacterized protein LOC129719454 [Wyeomyia smithii]|uniref:uncharacterized protein LOC129719454 n=1 Tax=Wyeomyia smithii TaxID=174621 RepID=UPI002467F56D|nr:uncharacterized protein LOC129719454 [Wyeomyia smithii]